MTTHPTQSGGKKSISCCETINKSFAKHITKDSMVFVCGHFHKETKQKLYGWYDSSDQPADKPSYNPPLICLYCVKNIPKTKCRTVSIYKPRDPRAYFYRVHKKCHEKATEDEKAMYESSIIDQPL